MAWTVPALLHFDGTAGSTTYTNDNGSGLAFSNIAGGIAALSTTSPVFGTAQLAIGSGNNTGGIASSASIALTGDFTFEGRHTTPNRAFAGAVFSVGDVSTNANSIILQQNTSGGAGGNLNLLIGGAIVIATAANSITNGTPFAWAVVRVGSTLYLFQDGVLIGTATNSATLGSDVLRIGTYWDGGAVFSGGSSFGNFADEFRYTDGLGRYTASYTVATSAFVLDNGLSITVQPVDQKAAVGGTATFTVADSGATTYQWQESIGGSAFANVASGTGGTTASYTTAPATQAFQGRRYRVVLDSGSATSDSAALAVVGFPIYLWPSNVPSGNDVWLRDPTGSTTAANVTGAIALPAFTASGTLSNPNALWTPALISSATVGGWFVSDNPANTVVSGDVTVLADKSGGGNNTTLFSGSAGNAAVNTSATLNGRPVWTTSAAKQGMYEFGGLAISNAASGLTLAVVMRSATSQTANAVDGTPMMALNRNSGPNARAYLARAATTNADVYGGGRRLDADAFAASSDGVNHGTSWVNINLGLDYANSDLLLSVDGTTTANTNFQTNGSSSATDGSSNQLGHQAGTPEYGDYAEALAIRGVLTTTERQKLEGYLAWSWGLQGNLVSGHPYASAPPLATSAISLTGAPTLAAFVSSGTLISVEQINGAASIGPFTTSGALGAVESLTGAAAVGSFTTSGVLAALAQVNGTPTLPGFTSAGVLGAVESVTGAPALSAFTTSGTLLAQGGLTGNATAGNFTSTGTLSATEAIAGAFTLPPFTTAGTLVGVGSLTGSPTASNFTTTGAVAAVESLTGSFTLAALSSTGTLAAAAQLTGTPALAAFTTSGALQGGANGLTGALTLPAFTSTGAASAIEALAGAPTLAPFTTSGSVAAPARMTGTASVPSFTTTGAVAAIDSVTGSPAVGAFIASGTLADVAGLSGNATLASFTSAGTLTATVQLTGSPSIGTLSFVGGFLGGNNGVTGNVTLPAFTTTAALALRGALTGTAAVGGFTTTGALAEVAMVSGTPTLGPFVTSGALAVQPAGLVGAITLPALTAAGTMTTTVSVASTITLAQFAAAGAMAAIAKASGSPTLAPFIVAGAIAQQRFVAGSPTLGPVLVAGALTTGPLSGLSGTIVLGPITLAAYTRHVVAFVRTSRTFDVPGEDRTFVVAGEDRTIYLE